MDSSQSSSRNAALKKLRRQTAVYPNINSTNKIEKPFSKSAAKRDSVLALGSIEHLQHYFTKTGLSASKTPLSGKGLFVPALGPLAIPQDQPSIPTLTFDLPPSPEVPRSDAQPLPPVDPSPFVDTNALKAIAIQDLEDVQACWSLSSSGSSTLGLQGMKFLDPSGSSTFSNNLDILELLKATTRAIRSVRNYVVALPEDDPSLTFRPHVVDAFRNQPHQKVKYASLRVFPSPKKTTKALHPTSGLATQIPTVPLPPSPLTLIRKSALDVLGALRDIEERYRLPLADDPFEITSSGGGNGSTLQSLTTFLTERTASPSAHSADDDVSDLGGGTVVSSSTSWSSPQRGRRSVTKSPVKPDVVPLIVQGRDKAVHVWADPSDDEWEDDFDKESKRDAWDERLVLGGGWLYQNDVDLSRLNKEREVVSRYLDLVDEILFGSATGTGQRGWVRAKRDMVNGSKVGRRGGRSSFGGVEGSPRRTDEKRLVNPVLLHAMNDFATIKEAEGTGDDAVIEEEEEEIPDHELPDWAKRSKFENEPVCRLLSFLIYHLPLGLLSFLPFPPTPPSSPTASPSSAQRTFRSKLLEVLSDGQIICTAYNGAVRKSKKPWGFIQLETVHDLLGLTEDSDADEEDPMTLGLRNKGKVSWTFRRTENLRYWAAAVGLRYMIPITASHDSLGKSLKLPRTFVDPILSPPIYFDPKIPARREAGWEDMLERALLRWLDAVLAETRSP